ncbi:MAG: hypothetical protein QOC97_1857, partial [Chloroflexota bacterium]|nr:hypothetical protein [Chloroflexota bacterium]
FWYSSLLIDFQAVLTATLRLFGGPPIDTNQGFLFDTELLPVRFGYLLAGREMVLGLGLATIAVVFAIGRELRGPLTGLLAAAILAAMPLHISDSRYLTTDVPVALFCALTLWFTLKAYNGRRERWWLLAGAAAGLAASTKWNGAIVLGVPLLAYLLTAERPRDLLGLFRRRTPYLITLAAVTALVITTPAILFDAATVLDYFRQQAAIYSQPRRAATADSLSLNLRGLIDGMGPVTAALAGIGLARLTVRPQPRVELTIPAFVVVTFVVVSIPPREFDRNLIPILPYLAIAAACLMADVPGGARKLAGRRSIGSADLMRRVAIAGAALALVACLLPGAAAGVASGRQAVITDTRTVARDWLLANVGRQTAIARERDTPVLLPDEFRFRGRYYLSTRPLEWYRSAGTQLLVTSSDAYAQFVGNPTTPDPDAWYRALFKLPELFRVDPGPDQPGPTIRVFELAPFTRVGDGS